MVTLSSTILIVCLIFSIKASVQAESTSEPSERPPSPAYNGTDVATLFACNNDHKPLEPQQSSKLLVGIQFGADKSGLRSEDNIKALVEVSKMSEEKCDAQIIAYLVHLRNENFHCKSLFNYIDYYLKEQAVVCKRRFGRRLRLQLADMMLQLSQDTIQAVSKINKLKSTIIMLMQNEIANESNRDDQINREAAINVLSVIIPQGILERGLAMYLDGNHFASNDEKKITEYIHEEFRVAIETMNKYLKPLMSLPEQLYRIAPEEPQNYGPEAKYVMIDFELVQMLSEDRFWAESVAKWMSKKEKSEGLSLWSKLIRFLTNFQIDDSRSHQ